MQLGEIGAGKTVGEAVTAGPVVAPAVGTASFADSLAAALEGGVAAVPAGVEAAAGAEAAVAPTAALLAALPGAKADAVPVAAELPVAEDVPVAAAVGGDVPPADAMAAPEGELPAGEDAAPVEAPEGAEAGPVLPEGRDDGALPVEAVGGDDAPVGDEGAEEIADTGEGEEAVLPVYAEPVAVPLQQAAAVMLNDPALVAEAAGVAAPVPAAPPQPLREAMQRMLSIRVEVGAAAFGVTDAAPRPDGFEAAKGGEDTPALRPLRKKAEAPPPVAERVVPKPAERALPLPHQPVAETRRDDGPAPPAPVAQAAPQPTLPAAPDRSVAAAPLRTDLPGWEQVLGERIAAELSEDGQEIDLSLSPEKLGPLRIKLEMLDGQAQVRIITATPEAARLFTEAQHRLTEGLARAGIDLGQQSAQSAPQGGGSPGGGGGSRGEDRPAFRGRMNDFLTRTGRAGEGEGPASRRAGAGLVNLMA